MGQLAGYAGGAVGIGFGGTTGAYHSSKLQQLKYARDKQAGVKNIRDRSQNIMADTLISSIPGLGAVNNHAIMKRRKELEQLVKKKK